MMSSNLVFLHFSECSSNWEKVIRTTSKDIFQQIILSEIFFIRGFLKNCFVKNFELQKRRSFTSKKVFLKITQGAFSFTYVLETRVWSFWTIFSSY